MIVNVAGTVVGIEDESYVSKSGAMAGQTVRRVTVYVQQDPSGQTAPAEVSVDVLHLASVSEVVFGKATSVMCDAQAYNGERVARLVLRTKGHFSPQAAK